MSPKMDLPSGDKVFDDMPVRSDFLLQTCALKTVLFGLH